MAPLDAPTCPTCGQTLKYDVLRPQTDPDWFEDEE